jgi:hypothetical protein
MIKIWGRIIKNNKIVEQAESICTEDLTYQEQLKKCILELCMKFDIQKPYWLTQNMNEYNRMGKTSFVQDNFTERINFDKFEIIELEEKKAD